ncbi:protein transport protein sec24 [Stemphylium lycopersici]|nr:protein transport protein sec24 [Stemphylium lycopersici]
MASLRGTQQPELSKKLFKIIKSENHAIGAYEAAARERVGIAQQLSEWGEATEDETISEISDKLGVLLAEIAEQEDVYAQALEEYRGVLKQIRNTESSVQPSRDHKAKVSDEIAKLKYKEPQSTKIVQLEQELVRAEAQSLVAEAQLNNITRQKFKEAYDHHFAATIERAEKQIILAKHARRLLNLVDDTPIVPGDAHPAFAEGETARQVLNDAEDDLRRYQLDVEPIHSNAGNLGVGAMPGAALPVATAGATGTSVPDSATYESAVTSDGPVARQHHHSSNTNSAPLPPPTSATFDMADRKKRDRYAAGTGYQFGANTQEAQAGAPPSVAPGYGAPAPAYGAPSPGYGAPAPGYGAPAPGYGAPSPYGQPAPQDPNALNQQFGQMNLGPGQAAPQVQQPVSATQQNQLFPSDLIAQPFHVSELYNPPPPINLPSNAAATPSEFANESSKYLRCTLNTIPTNHSLLKKSKLPFALVISPYASLHDSEDPIPVVQDQIISRCRRCRAYINPFVSFLDHGHRWRCNMCNLTNDVPQAFDWDAAQQKSVDRWQRPELNYAVTEFVAPQEYMVRPPQPLCYYIILDCTQAAVNTGLLAVVSRVIKESLGRIPNADGRTRIGFMAVDNGLHFFGIPPDNSESNEPQQLVVSDLDEPYLPMPTDLLVSLSQCRNNIETFLDRLPAMFQNTVVPGFALGSALRSAHKLISPLGGKLTVIAASLPNVGHAALSPREDKSVLGTSKEGSLLQPANNWYKSFAVECSKNQVSVDMFLFAQHYQDVATLSNLPRFTAGQTYFYPGWNAARQEDVVKIATELGDYLSAEIGLEAVLRVRATTGLRMSAFYGNFFNRSSDLCAFPAYPRDQAVVIEVAIDETISRPFACLQAAVLHTTSSGQRRIRVLTLAVPTTESLASVYASADAQAITTYFAHKAVERALSSGLDAARDALQGKIVEILSTYRKELAGGSMGGGGLQLPQNLRALPILFLGLIKNVGLRKSAQIPSDIRSAALDLLSTLPMRLLTQYIYPTFYSLHDMPDDAGVPEPTTGQITMPPSMNLSSVAIVPYGLYLIDDGVNQFIWVGRDAVPALLADVFGVEDRMQLKQGKATLPLLDNEYSERVRAVVEKSRDHKSKGVGSITLPTLYIVKEDGEPTLKQWAQTMLVEDRADQSDSLVQWITKLREKVQQ